MDLLGGVERVWKCVWMVGEYEREKDVSAWQLCRVRAGRGRSGRGVSWEGLSRVGGRSERTWGSQVGRSVRRPRGARWSDGGKGGWVFIMVGWVILGQVEGIQGWLSCVIFISLWVRCSGHVEFVFFCFESRVLYGLTSCLCRYILSSIFNKLVIITLGRSPYPGL